MSANGASIPSRRQRTEAWELLRIPERAGHPGLGDARRRRSELCRASGPRARPLYLHHPAHGRDDPGDIIAGLNAGADDYMTKPLQFQELRARLQTGRRIVDLEDKLWRARNGSMSWHQGRADGLWNRLTIIQFLEDELDHGRRAGTAPASS